MSRLYFATATEILYRIFEGPARLGASLLERFKILGILDEAVTDGLVNEIGQRAIGLRRLEPQGAVNLRIEIDCGAFRW
jgi:hypothetical protein